MSADLLILRAFETALKASLPDIDVAAANVLYEPAAHTTEYLKSAVLSARTVNPTLGDGFHRRPGVFQVTVVTKAGIGAKRALELVSTVSDAFSFGSVVHDADGVRILIDETPSVAPGVVEDAWYRVPVSISYVADVHPQP